MARYLVVYVNADGDWATRQVTAKDAGHAEVRLNDYDPAAHDAQALSSDELRQWADGLDKADAEGEVDEIDEEMIEV